MKQEESVLLGTTFSRRSDEEKARLTEYLRMIKPISVGMQTAGLMLWFISWALADSGYRYSTWLLVLLPVCICLSIAGACFTKFLSIFSIITLWLLSLAFSALLVASPDRLFWALSMSAIISLVAAPLFSRLREYATASLGVWLIFGNGGWIVAPHGVDMGWSYLMPCAVILLGLLMNGVFTRIHRDSVNLRKELEQLAYRDVLTGIANRRKLLNDIQQLHEVGQLDDGCFLMIDVDNFKKINDEFGHADGDLVLQAIAAVLRRVAGENSFGRLGGEEFGIMLRSGGTTHAQSISMQVLAAVRALTIQGRAIGVSVGISGIGNGRAPSELLREADVALYEAKRAGKDRFLQYGGDPGLQGVPTS